MSADKKQGGFGQYLRSSSTPCFNFSPEISFAKDRIGAFSLDDALAERKRKDATRYQWASIHALSPGLYNEFQARLKGGKDYERHDLAAQILDGRLHHEYRRGKETILCTEQEADAPYRHERPRPLSPIL